MIWWSQNIIDITFPIVMFYDRSKFKMSGGDNTLDFKRIKIF
nr:MAG TPA: hypothetical protein [Caudoviricetes sp.]